LGEKESGLNSIISLLKFDTFILKCYIATGTIGITELKEFVLCGPPCNIKVILFEVPKFAFRCELCSNKTLSAPPGYITDWFSTLESDL
jgi:hypothetical protein